MAKESQEINPAGIHLSRKSDTPLYQQVYEQFRDMIVKKRLRPGDRLPATRNLAKELGVSRVIISQAYELLLMEGYLVGKTGSGTFVAGKVPEALLNAPPPSPLKQKKKVIPISSGDKIDIVPFQTGVPSTDAFPFKIWQQVAAKVLKNLKQYNLAYDDTLGFRPLRQAIAAYLRLSRAVRCEAEQVVVVTGSQQGLNLITQCLISRGDKVWMEDPGYPGASKCFDGMGATLCPVPIEEDGLNIQYALEHYPDAKLAYVTPSHQFPMGCTLSAAKRKQLLQWAAKNKSWILEDDYDSEFRYEGRPLACLQGMDSDGRVIYCGTFSKVLFPGLRLAYIVLPSAELVSKFKQVKNAVDRQSPIIEQAIVAKFMEEGHFLRHVRKMRVLYSERQSLLMKLLREHLGKNITISVAPSGMQLLVWLPGSLDLVKFNEAIAEQQLAVAFVNDYALEHSRPPVISLGFTAFGKYKLKTGVEKLAQCFRAAQS